jgi:hypothetical protein
MPHFARLPDASSDLWPWLAIAGGLGLLAEWLLFGRFRRGAAGFRALPLRRKEPAPAEARR